MICTGEAWGLEVKALKPETARTLILLARDIYPHDRLADKFYAVAVKGYDEKAAKDPATLAELEGGVAALDAAAKAEYGVAYVDVGWEGQRVALLRPIEHGPFFQGIRSDLVGQPLQSKGALAALRVRGRKRLQGRVHPSRLQRHSVALRAAAETKRRNDMANFDLNDDFGRRHRRLGRGRRHARQRNWR